jgi:hypothetical protein
MRLSILRVSTRANGLPQQARRMNLARKLRHLGPGRIRRSPAPRLGGQHGRPRAIACGLETIGRQRRNSVQHFKKVRIIKKIPCPLLADNPIIQPRFQVD